MSLTTEQKLTKARVWMGQQYPFFGYLVYKMQLEEKPDKWFENMHAPKTMCVDQYGHCYYNKGFVDGLTNETVQSALSHELLHLALCHLSRCGHRSPEGFNIASDLAVNSILKESGFTIPKEWVTADYNNNFTMGKTVINNISGKAAEKIYDEMPKVTVYLQYGGGGKGNGNGKNNNEDGEGEDGSMKGKYQMDGHIFGNRDPKIEQEWKENITAAAMHAKARGNLPAGIQRLVDGLLNPQVNWRHLLWKYVLNTQNVDFTWSRPSRRTYSTGIYLPSTLKESIEISVAIDTSGSIGAFELTEFCSEIVSISKSFARIKMNIIICDCAIQETYELTNGNIRKFLSTKLKGGGGTDHKIVQDWLIKNKPDTKLAIYFTDGFTSFPERERIPTLWVISSNGCGLKDIPYGTKIKLKDTGKHE